MSTTLQHIDASDYKPFMKRFILQQPTYFNWLPAHIFNGSDIAILQQLERPSDFFRYIVEFEPCFKKTAIYLYKPRKPSTFKASNLNPANYFHQQIRSFIRLAIIALRLRSAFRRFVHHWIWKKAAAHPPSNEDIITLSPFIQPIDIMDMKHRRIYRFEARSLLKHIDSQLSYMNHGYPAPQLPKNPYTNIQFSSAQFCIIYDRLLSYKLISSSFIGFYECKFNIVRYEKMHKELIDNMNTFNNMKDYKNEDGQHGLVEFINSIANHLDHPHTDDEIDLYYYASDEIPTHPIFIRWRKLYIQHHFLDDMEQSEARQVLHTIYKEAENLLHMQATFFAEIQRLKIKNNHS
jgi:hypothetical protein